RQNADDNEESDQDETTSSEEEDHEEDFEAELDTVVETLSPNQDTEVTEGINALREHYKALNRNILIPAANIPEKELHHGNEENDNSKCSEVENYLDNSDVESLDEEILEDGTTQMRRTPVRFPRYDENSPWIPEQWETMIYAHPDIKPTYIQDTIKAQLELEVTRSQYTNPGSSVDIEVEQIGLDGCFLKGVVKGMLLTAVGKDPNNQMFPVAWAIVEIESESSWTWFLRRLRVDIKTQDRDDKQKGLLNTVATIFPKAEHRLCASHI
ncbi:elongation factor G, III-V domain-containing protein, partial [Tanacetum coccineum]